MVFLIGFLACNDFVLIFTFIDCAFRQLVSKRGLSHLKLQIGEPRHAFASARSVVFRSYLTISRTICLSSWSFKQIDQYEKHQRPFTTVSKNDYPFRPCCLSTNEIFTNTAYTVCRQQFLPKEISMMRCDWPLQQVPETHFTSWWANGISSTSHQVDPRLQIKQTPKCHPLTDAPIH